MGCYFNSRKQAIPCRTTTNGTTLRAQHYCCKKALCNRKQHFVSCTFKFRHTRKCNISIFQHIFTVLTSHLKLKKVNVWICKLNRT
ncbi:hypothetical protein FKM82_028864 [Ascaphus truei]